MRKILPLIFSVVFLLSAVGCAALQQAMDMPEKRALAMVKTWNAQYDDTLALARQCQAGECSEGQKSLVIKKREWLKLSKPLVELYVNKVLSGEDVPTTIEKAIRQIIGQLVAGVEPTADTESMINALINKLVSEED